MPEVINNVTTGSGLLHEVFQETLKQSLQSAGFHVYEYDQASGRFKSTIDGRDLGMEVRFARMGYLFNFGASGENTFIHGNVVVDWLEGGEVVPLLFNLSSPYEKKICIIKLSSGSVSSVISRDVYDPRSFSHHEILLMNPKPGYLIAYALGRSSDPSYYYNQDFCALYSYNLSSNSISEVYFAPTSIRSAPTSIRSNSGWDVFGLGGHGDGSRLGHFVSKVYKYEDSTYVRYTVFTFYHRNGGELYINTITFNKSNNSVSYNRKLVHQGLYTTYKDQFYPPGGESTWFWSPYTSVKTDDYYAGIQIYLREALSVVSGNNISGNLIFAFRGLPPNSYDVVLELIPFTASLDFSTYDNTTFNLQLENKVVYSPFNMRTIYKDAYVTQDQSKLEVPRSSSYTPPSNYLTKIDGVSMTTPNTNFLVVTSDIDQGGRLRVSSVLSMGIPAEVEREGGGLYAHPATFFINYELTESGSYFTGFSSIEPWGVKGPFFISKYHGKVFTFTRVLPTKKGEKNEQHFLYLLTMESPLPDRVNWGAGLAQRVTQPYIAELPLGGLRVYKINRNNSNPSKTEFVNTGKVYLTSFVQTNFHGNGYFTPLFIVTNGGGDGVWLDAGTLYIGLDTYDPQTPSDTWRRIFAVNGAVSAIRTHEDNYDYPSQVNSTISIVTKFIVSPQGSTVSIIGIQGQNRLRFLSLYVLDDSQYFVYPQLFLPFGNLSLGITSFDWKLVPLAQVMYYQTITNNTYFPHYNKHYKWYNLAKRTATPNSPIVIQDIRDRANKQSFLFYGSRVQNPPSVDFPSAVVFVNSGFEGLFGFTPRIAVFPKERLSLATAYDSSNTLVEGDYVVLKDVSNPSNPVSMKYVVTSTSSVSFYTNPWDRSTSTRRALELVLVDVLSN